MISFSLSFFFVPAFRRRHRLRNIFCTFLLLQKSTKKAGPKTMYNAFSALALIELKYLNSRRALISYLGQST